jgi:hypothetical protein
MFFCVAETIFEGRVLRGQTWTAVNEKCRLNFKILKIRLSTFVKVKCSGSLLFDKLFRLVLGFDILFKRLNCYTTTRCPYLEEISHGASSKTELFFQQDGSKQV